MKQKSFVGELPLKNLPWLVDIASRCRCHLIGRKRCFVRANGEGLTLETKSIIRPLSTAFYKIQFSCFTLLPTQHRSFFRILRFVKRCCSFFLFLLHYLTIAHCFQCVTRHLSLQWRPNSQHSRRSFEHYFPSFEFIGRFAHELFLLQHLPNGTWSQIFQDKKGNTEELLKTKQIT